MKKPAPNARWASKWGAIFLASYFILFSFNSALGQEAAAVGESASSTPREQGPTHEELAAQIEERNKQLEGITADLEAARKQLEETQKEKRTLQGELSKIQGNINQLNLNIKADEVRIQKAGLEIDSLNLDLRDIISSIDAKRLTISKIMVELQKQNGAQELLLVFLESRSLTDTFLKTQALKNLQNQLALDISNLLNLHEKYAGKIEEISSKRTDVVQNQRNLEYRKLIAGDQKTERQALLRQTKNREGAFQKQAEELEKLRAEIANEIEALGAILRTKIDPATLPPLKPGILGMPIETKTAITQGYGSTDFAKSGYKGKWHNGVDYRAPLGTPVLASEEGEVVALGDQDSYCYKGAYGKFVIINHANNLTTLYAHLSRIAVSKGSAVKRGEVIGYSGQTGYATGPHLHLTVFAQPTFYMGPSKVCGPMPFGGDLNPLGYL